MSAFCAICTRDIVGSVRREPIGPNDALVSVCESCAEPVCIRSPDGGPDADIEAAVQQVVEPNPARRRYHGDQVNPVYERAAKMVYETGCSLAEAAREHGAHRGHLSEVYRKLYPKAATRSRKSGATP